MTTDPLLYRRIVSPGGRVTYEPWGRRYSLDAAPLGWHLLHVQPGQRSALYGIEPDRAGTLAALRLARPAVVAAVARALEDRPHPDTESQRRALEAYHAAGGHPGGGWTRATADDVLSAVEQVLRQKDTPNPGGPRG